MSVRVLKERKCLERGISFGTEGERVRGREEEDSRRGLSPVSRYDTECNGVSGRLDQLNCLCL